MGRLSWLVRALVALGFASGCLDFSAGRCEDGRLCPESWTCDEVNHLCIPPGCGDGKIGGAEQCDGTLLQTDCTGLGFYEPQGLACRSDCTYDIASCSARCGDRTINGPELCDGLPPARQSCVDYGYSLGRLDCSVGCGPSISGCDQIGWHSALGGATSALRGIWGGGTEMFAVGTAGTILHSTGGAWLTMPSGSTADLHAVWGSDPANVFAVGADGTILHFNGTQWSAMTSNTSATLFGVWGSAPNMVFAVGAAGTIARFDGTSWTATTETTYELHGVSGSNGVVLAVGRSGTVLRYDGASWTRMTTPSGSHIYAVEMRGANAFAVGQNGTVWKLNSSGWSNVPQTLTTYDLLSIWSSSDTDVFIGGGYGRLLHYDGAFVQHDPGSARSITGLWGVSADHVFGVTQGGTVQEYTGSRWVMEPAAGSSVELTRVLRFDNGHALALGHSATVAQFNGTTWATKTIANTNWLRSIWAKDEQNVLIAGDDVSGGTAGVYFGNYASGFTRVLSGGPLAVWGSSNGDIWAAGNASVISKASITSPSSWTQMYGMTGSSLPDFYAMWGSSPNDIVAVGERGAIVHYDGVSWSAMTTPTTLELDDVWGAASDNIFAVGEQGLILHYNGTAWRRMTSGTGENLVSVSGTGPDDVWIAATNNTILHFDGVSWSRVEPGAPGDFRGVAASPRAYLFVGMAGAHHRIERICAAREDHCGNAWDDDCDGLINCADSDCDGSSECSRGGACPRVADLACGSDIRGSTFTGIGRIDELRCSAHSTPGPEAAYRFTAPASGTTTVSLSELTTDLDVSVTGAFDVTAACDLATCIASSAVSGAAKSITFDAVANTSYYIIVDGPIDTAGDFRLEVSCP